MCTKVLIVDDEAFIREYASTILAKEGVGIFQAGSGEEALKLLEEAERPFDLVVTDNTMGKGMTGKDLAWRIEKMPRHERTVVIMTSGDGGLTCEDCRVDAIVRKPFKPTTLQAVAAMITER